MAILRTAAAVLFVILSLSINFAHALTIEFFAGANYRSFIQKFEKSSGDDGGCYDLGESITIKSVRTDTCVMMYDSEDCTRMKGRTLEKYGDLYYSYRVDNSTAFLNKTSYLGRWYTNRKVQSFHKCSQDLGGGPSLDVDFYDKPLFSDDGGKIALRWRDICTCQNVPNSFNRGKIFNKFSIDNHGNNMVIFDRENCEGRDFYLYAGDNIFTRSVVYPLSGLNYDFNVRSFVPAGPIECLKLDARIFKFHFKNGTGGGGEGKTEKVKLAYTSTVVNDGAASTTEEYTISEKVIESLEYSVAEGYTEMHSAGAEASITSTTEAGIPFIGKTEISVSLSANYQYSKENSGSNTKTNTATTETTVEIKKSVTVPACQTCKITGYVKQAKDFPVDYDSYSKITGMAGNTRLRAEMLKNYLPASVHYVRDIDEFTVEAVTQGTMYADYGVETLIVVKCDPLPGCGSSTYMNEPTKTTYELPFVTVDKEIQKSGYQSANEIGAPMSDDGKGFYLQGLSEMS